MFLVIFVPFGPKALLAVKHESPLLDHFGNCKISQKYIPIVNHKMSKMYEIKTLEICQI